MPSAVTLGGAVVIAGSVDAVGAHRRAPAKLRHLRASSTASASPRRPGRGGASDCGRWCRCWPSVGVVVAWRLVRHAAVGCAGVRRRRLRRWRSASPSLVAPEVRTGRRSSPARRSPRVGRRSSLGAGGTWRRRSASHPLAAIGRAPRLRTLGLSVIIPSTPRSSSRSISAASSMVHTCTSTPSRCARSTKRSRYHRDPALPHRHLGDAAGREREAGDAQRGDLDAGRARCTGRAESGAQLPQPAVAERRRRTRGRARSRAPDRGERRRRRRSACSRC